MLEEWTGRIGQEAEGKALKLFEQWEQHRGQFGEQREEHRVVKLFADEQRVRKMGKTPVACQYFRQPMHQGLQGGQLERPVISSRAETREAIGESKEEQKTRTEAARTKGKGDQRSLSWREEGQGKSKENKGKGKDKDEGKKGDK